MIKILNKKYLLLLLIYTSQYLPLGFFYGAIPAILGSQNVSLETIGSFYMLGLIWVFKFIWAPYIDKFKIPFIEGHYRSWIIIVQVLMACTMFICAYFPLITSFYMAMILIGIINFLSSTQDICVDGLAINSLKKNQLEYANSMQATGTFLGTLVGLALPLYSYEIYNWKVSLIILSLLVLIPTFFLFNYKENSFKKNIKRISFKEIYLFLKEKNGFKILLMLFPAYLIVERSFPLIQQILIQNNWFLIDIVIAQNIIGSIVGIIAAIITGSLINKFGKRKCFIYLLFFIFVDICLLYLFTYFTHNHLFVIFVLSFNSLCLGSFVTIYYTYIMANSSKEYAGTHVNVQHSLLLFASLLSTKVIFMLVDFYNFRTVFICIAIIFVFSLYLIRKNIYE